MRPHFESREREQIWVSNLVTLFNFVLEMSACFRSLISSQCLGFWTRSVSIAGTVKCACYNFQNCGMQGFGRWLSLKGDYYCARINMFESPTPVLKAQHVYEGHTSNFSSGKLGIAISRLPKLIGQQLDDLQINRRTLPQKQNNMKKIENR